jgi:hypothetical protein
MSNPRDDYQKKLSEALDARLQWLKASELPKIKEEVHAFQSAFSTLYTFLLRKGMVSEDPYKDKTESSEIQIPETRAFSPSEKQEQLSSRMASYDKQLGLLVNSYQFNMKLFTLERTRRIRTLINYIGWGHLSVDAEDINTYTVAELVSTARHTGDHTTQSLLNGTLSSLGKMLISINKRLNNIQKYNREMYKLELRKSVLPALKESPSLEMVKRAAMNSMSKSLFYPELAEEVLKEDYSPNGSALQAAVLEKLKVVVEAKPAMPKEVVLKVFLLEGIQVFGSVASTLSEIWIKFDENHNVLENQKRSTWKKIQQVLIRIFNLKTGTEPCIYDIKYVESESGTLIREQVNFQKFMLELEANTKSCSSIVHNLETQSEPQLFVALDRQIVDIQKCYKTLVGLDDYFKAQIKADAHSHVKGIKPELSAIKNALFKANQQHAEYLSQREKLIQFKSSAPH